VSRGLALHFPGPRHSRWGEGSAPRPGRLYPPERPGTHCTGCWVGPGPVWTGGKSRPHRDSILSLPARTSVAIPTELPGPQPNSGILIQNNPLLVPSTHLSSNLLQPTGHVMHQQFNIQQLYALPTLYLYVLYLSENKQRLVPLTA